MTATVTKMSTRTEMRARRSAAKHAALIAGAATPQQMNDALGDEMAAFIAQNPALAEQVVAEQAAAQAQILARARMQAARMNAQVRGGARRRVA